MKNGCVMLRRFFGVALILVSHGLDARELRTPWSLQNGYMHNILPRPLDCDDEHCWNIDVWGGGLHKQANKAFTNTMGTKTDSSLAGIIFGSDTFLVKDTLPPTSTIANNPFVNFALVHPIITYAENSAYFGFTFEKPLGCQKRWHIGVRAVMPFRALKTTLENCCDIEETLADVCRMQYDRLINPISGIADTVYPISWAYRLDFVSSLFIQQAGVLPFEPFVDYTTPIDMNDVNVTEINNNPIYVTQRDNGTVPGGPFAKLQGPVSALPALNGSGAGLANNAQARFVSTQDYTVLGANKAQQRQLWILPTANALTGAAIEQVQGANNIGNKIADLTRTLGGQGAVEFLEDNGVDLGTNQFVGAGDFDTMFYADYEFCRGLVEGFIDVRWPTGIKVRDPQKVLSIFTTGNNRHFEIKFGAAGLWEPACWFSAQVDIMFAQAFKGTEKVAAPFKGATVKNIGPTVKADIGWNYAVGHLGFNFLVPCNPRVGFMVGYEWYYKGEDKITFKQSQATDFAGNVQLLNPDLLSYRTNVIAHKVRTEMFHQGNQWELFGGWTHVFAGKNAPKETDWHLGFAAYF